MFDLHQFLDEHHGRTKEVKRERKLTLIATLEAPAVSTPVMPGISTASPSAAYEIVIGGGRMYVEMTTHQAAELEELILAVRAQIGHRLSVGMQPVPVRTHAEAGKWLLDVLSGKWA